VGETICTEYPKRLALVDLNCTSLGWWEKTEVAMGHVENGAMKTSEGTHRGSGRFRVVTCFTH
jgi:hypothetical protein